MFEIEFFGYEKLASDDCDGDGEQIVQRMHEDSTPKAIRCQFITGSTVAGRLTGRSSSHLSEMPVP